MTEVAFRKMRFDIDRSIPFQWNPANPASGVQANMISFMIVGLERYIVLAVREALRAIDEPRLREEAEVFIAQESQHTAAHRKHVNSLIARYPGLRSTLDGVNRSYEELYAHESLQFHLAYIANLEATFPPLFTFMIEHRDRLYNGDCRVASLFLWHYIEEIEHRSSAEIIFDGVVGRPLYRLRVLPKAARHVTALSQLVAAGFEASVPAGDLGAPVDSATKAIWKNEFRSRTRLSKRDRSAVSETIYSGIPTTRLLKLVVGLVQSQLPNHHPSDVEVPDWYDTWMASYHSGEDMAHYFGTTAAVG